MFKFVDSLIPAEPIVDLRHQYAEGTHSPAWRRRRINNKTLKKRKKARKANRVDTDGSLTLSDESQSEDDLPGESVEGGGDSPLKNRNLAAEEAPETQHKNNDIQDKLTRVAEKIPIQTQRSIQLEKYPDMFQYQVYDGYRPQNLAQTRDYLNFLTKSNKNNEQFHNEEEIPAHICEYMKQTLTTQFPDTINQRHILSFDQNFECGNLDSAFLKTSLEYNLLMKVDSNTRGNTYWFMFKVTNFIVGKTYTFNILNFTRSLEKFYREKMNIVTKTEAIGPPETIEPSIDTANPAPSQSSNNQNQQESCSKEDAAAEGSGEWRYNTCKNIQFELSEIVRSKQSIWRNNSEMIAY